MHYIDLAYVTALTFATFLEQREVNHNITIVTPKDNGVSDKKNACSNHFRVIYCHLLCQQNLSIPMTIEKRRFYSISLSYF